MGRLLLVTAIALAACRSGSSNRPPAPPPGDAHPAVTAHDDPPIEPGPPHPTQLAVGAGHACARMSDDTLRCWGSNDFAELGGGTFDVRVKQATPPLTNVVEVSAGYGFTCARLRDHTVRCWGNALDGEIGVASPTDPEVNHTIFVPTAVPGVTDAVQLSSWLKHTCAARADGTVVCWGDDTYGQLGDGKTATTLGAVTVAGLDNVTQVDAGNFSCARKVDGTVRCWGVDVGPKPQPVAVTDVAQIVTGNLVGCARDRAGAVACWGLNDSGQLGRTDETPDVPTPIAGLTGATDVAIGGTHGCAIVGHELRCWGTAAINPAFPPACLRMTAHTGGGGGSPAQWQYCPTPTAVPGVVDPVDVETLMDMTCALTAAHTIVCLNGTATPTELPL